MKRTIIFSLSIATLAMLWVAGCGDPHSEQRGSVEHHKHKHIPPHGGTPVVFGREQYHLEFVLEATNGLMQAYFLDGHMENFVRTTNASFAVAAQVNGKSEILSFNAVATTASGETVGDSAFFEARAEWLKFTTNFDASIKMLSIRGTRFENVTFNFPKGNESHAGH